MINEVTRNVNDYDDRVKRSDRLHETARKEILERIKDSPVVLLQELDEYDVVMHLIGSCTDLLKIEGRTAARFLERSIPDVIEYLTEKLVEEKLLEADDEDA